MGGVPPRDTRTLEFSLYPLIPKDLTPQPGKITCTLASRLGPDTGFVRQGGTALVWMGCFEPPEWEPC